MSIIQAIFESDQDDLSPQQTQLLEEVISYHNKIQAVFGLEFVDEMVAAQNRLEDASLLDTYERGFTDCFQLWLEVFSKYSS